MAVKFSIADTFNNTAGYAVITPQPFCPGILYPRRIIAVSGAEYNDGAPYTYFQFKGSLTPAQYNTILTAFGLSTALSNDVTVALLVDALRATYIDYNGTIFKPVNGQDVRFELGRWWDATFKIKGLVAI
jgi:hypothetical protein